MASQTKTSTSELAWDHAVLDIPERGIKEQREATPEERAHIARALELAGCAALKAEYTVKPSLDGRYRVFGTFAAEVTQACVVTLEPVDSTIEDGFDATFWPSEQVPAAEGGAITLDDEPEPEAIMGGQIAVGRIVFECLAAAIDPFPRKPGAELEQRASGPPGGEASKPESPFAVLAKIKPKT
jgi:uncharacterized protein